MPRKPTGKPNGRPPIKVIPVSVGLPPKEIILDQVLYWIDRQATADEIAGSFHVSTDTLSAKIKEHFGMTFSELYKRCNGGCKLTLRKYQFQMAEKNASMAIFLGKVWLGQRDNSIEELQQEVEDVRSAVRELQEQRRGEATQRPLLENQQPILHQGRRREEDKIQTELGARGAME